MKVDFAIVFILLVGAVMPFEPCCAAGHALQCESVEEDRRITLEAVSVANGIEKLVLTGTSGVMHEYLIEGVRKIPVGDERALFGSLLSDRKTGRQHELLLEPGSYFEMYAGLDKARAAEAVNTIFIFDHQGSLTETLDLRTGKRTWDEPLIPGKIPLRCEKYYEYLHYIEHLDSASASDSPAWKRMTARRMQYHGDKFASAYIDHDLVFNNQFLGVDVWQNPFDMWVFQQIITELKPDVIIETGTAHGGSALFFATMLEKVNPFGRVITVEIDPDVDRNISEARSFPVFSERIRLVKGDSVSSRTLGQIQELIDELETKNSVRNISSGKHGLTVLVTLDSLHSAEHVLEELRHYSRFVSKGSYIVVQDTIIDLHPKYFDWFVRPWAKDSVAGPGHAVDEFLKETPGFQRDKRWEKYYFTFYPGGFLRKTR